MIHNWPRSSCLRSVGVTCLASSKRWACRVHPIAASWFQAAWPLTTIARSTKASLWFGINSNKWAQQETFVTRRSMCLHWRGKITWRPRSIAFMAGRPLGTSTLQLQGRSEPRKDPFQLPKCSSFNLQDRAQDRLFSWKTLSNNSKA